MRSRWLGNPLTSSRSPIFAFPVIWSAWSIPVLAQGVDKLPAPIRERLGELGLLRQGDPNWDTAPMLIETSAELTNLLDRADEAAARDDWKLAVDSLQRVIDDAGGSLIPRSIAGFDGGALYESARRYATRQVSTLPPEGLRAYRLVHDGKALGLLRKGKADHDESALRVVVERFLLTSVGDDASDLLASWALDEGRPGEAAALLADVIELVPDHDVPDELIFGKLAVANALLGRATEAEALLDGVRTRGESSWLAKVDPAAIIELSEAPGVSKAVARRSPLTANETDVSLKPAIVPDTPWRQELSGKGPDLWRRALDAEEDEPAELPLSELVTDGELVFARRAGGAMAFRAADLSPVWDAKINDPAAQTTARRLTTLLRAQSNAPPAYQGDAIQLVCAAGEAVYIVEESGRGTFDGVTLEEGPMTPAEATAAVGTSQLIALDSASGNVKWKRGRTGVPTDPLGDVGFSSTPIEVNGRIFAPYFKRKDFYLALLDPDTGGLIREVLLGSVRDFAGMRRYATPLTHANGVVYVPSGFGMLFAVDAQDGTLRWGSQYRRSLDVEGGAEHEGWIPSAPAVSGGVILLAAVDRTELLAFSANDGSFQWSAAIPGAKYILSAAGGKVWLGGAGLACLSLSGGAAIWQTSIQSRVTGRAAKTGDFLHVPTTEGVVTFSADSGSEVERQSLPEGTAPLGNLLAVGPALFSLDGSLIRRFTDIERAQQSALAEHNADPTNLRAATHLAWVELLRKNARAGLTVTDRLWPADKADPEALGLARVRLETLITLAADASDSSEALAFLDHATKAAWTSEQRLRVRLAIADRQLSSGSLADAHKTLVELGLDTSAEQTILLTDAVRVSAHRQIAVKLAEVRKRMDAEQRTVVERQFGSLFEQTINQLESGDGAADAEQRLRTAAALYPEGAGRALLALAAAERKTGRFERAEQCHLEGLRSAEGAARPDAHMALCGLYGPDGQDVPAMYAACVAEVSSRYAQPAPGTLEPTAEARRVAEWVAQQDASVSGPAADAAKGSPSLTGERLWGYGFPNGVLPPRLVDFDGTLPSSLADRILVLGMDGEMHCLDAASGAVSAEAPRMLWETELRLPGRFDDAPRAIREVTQSRRAVVEGQIAVFNSLEGLFAVGLVTGRRLWVQPYDAPLDPEYVAFRDSVMAAGDGCVAATPHAGRLSLLRLLDGSTIWERDLRGERVAHLWMTAGRVVTADAALQRVHIFDRADGRVVNQVLFAQPEPEIGPTRLIFAGSTLCGPNNAPDAEAVRGVDLETGEERWRYPVSKPVVQLFQPGDHYLGAGLLGGDVLILDAATGDLVLERHVSNGLPVIDGALVDGTLVVLGERRQGQMRVPELSAIDVATGEELWPRNDLAALQEPAGRLLVYDGATPAILTSMETTVDGRRIQSAQKNELSLAMIDVRTGGVSGETVDLPPTNTGTRVNRDLAIRPGMIAVGSNRAIQAFRLAAPQSGPQSP
jgi:outer membrane protein assembly factor BamB